MSILILGNGFDLEHKLPTRYTDFWDYVIAKKIVIGCEKYCHRFLDN